MDPVLLKNVICIFIGLLAMILLLLPNHIIDTTSCKKNWVAVLVILASGSFIINKTLLGIFIILVLAVALFIHYLNVYIERQTHEC